LFFTSAFSLDQIKNDKNLQKEISKLKAEVCLSQTTIKELDIASDACLVASLEYLKRKLVKNYRLIDNTMQK
jgi:hypothetical protein